MKASYLTIPREELIRRVGIAKEKLKKCDLCPNDCGVDRTAGELGFCHGGANAKVASSNLHFGEEPAISGMRGSGTIFFSNCTMKCAYCQNWPISHKGNGEEVDAAGLAKMMLTLQARGAHNVNFVTPTHYMPQILEALSIAIEDGFGIPIVYNTSGYETLAALKLLEGVVDIYLPDMRYALDEHAKKYSRAKGYTAYNKAAIREMFRQVGLLEVDGMGIAGRGLIVRHLVLPGGLSGTEEIMRFLADEVSKFVSISLMDQYFPTYRAVEFPEINRKITSREYQAAMEIMEKYDLHEGWVQEHV